MAKDTFAFVLMPFEKSFDDVYKLGIKAAAEENGVKAQRVDEQIFNDSILNRIYRQIEQADFIIADMSDKKPNVFYEVGYAHALKKKCILLTKSVDHIPFDLSQHRHIIYDGSVSKLKEQLSADIMWMKEQIESEQNSVFEVELKAKFPSLETSEYRATGKFDLEITVRNVSGSRSPEIDAIYLYTSDKWKFIQAAKPCDLEFLEREEFRAQHMIIPSMRRIPKHRRFVENVEGTRVFWSKFLDGEELQDKYKSAGRIKVEVVTADRTFISESNLELEFQEFPF